MTEQRGVPQSERRHPMIADILTFLGHQSPFVRKLTFVIQKQPAGEVATGLATVRSTTRPTDGYCSDALGSRRLDDDAGVHGAGSRSPTESISLTRRQQRSI